MYVRLYGRLHDSCAFLYGSCPCAHMCWFNPYIVGPREMLHTLYMRITLYMHVTCDSVKVKVHTWSEYYSYP